MIIFIVEVQVRGCLGENCSTIPDYIALINVLAADYSQAAKYTYRSAPQDNSKSTFESVKDVEVGIERSQRNEILTKMRTESCVPSP
jgi:hypothetical protein